MSLVPFDGSGDFALLVLDQPQRKAREAEGRNEQHPGSAGQCLRSIVRHRVPGLLRDFRVQLLEDDGKGDGGAKRRGQPDALEKAPIEVNGLLRALLQVLLGLWLLHFKVPSPRLRRRQRRVDGGKVWGHACG